MVYFYLQDDAKMETEMLRQFARFMKTGIKKNTNLYLFTDTKTWILNLNVSKPSDVLQFFLFFFFFWTTRKFLEDIWKEERKKNR